MGDEFTGPSIQRVLDEVDRMNARDAKGGRRVRIHAVGFPTLFGSEQVARRTRPFASRSSCGPCASATAGPFVGLNSLTP